MASNKQLAVRRAFKQCTRCFANQPQTGGVEPPDIGPRSREWWYDNSGGLWYYNNFIQDSMAHYLIDEDPPWCKSTPILLDNGYYVDAHNPDSIYDTGSFFYAGAWKYGGGETPYIRRSFLSFKISGILQEDAEKSTGFIILFSYKNSIHPLEPPLLPEITIDWRYVPQEGKLTGVSWNNQPGAGQGLVSFGCASSVDSSVFFGIIKITDLYKGLIADGKTHFNIRLSAADEGGTKYPLDPITVYEDEYFGEGTNILAYLSYGR